MLNNDLESYKKMDYTIIVEKQELDGESWFIAYTNELGKLACYGRGETQAEALNSFLEEKDAFIEYLFVEGRDIPKPIKGVTEKYSGFFNVRTSPVIHANLVYQAREMDISLNLYVNQILSAAIEKKSTETDMMKKLNEICEKIDNHHCEVTNRLRYQKGSFSSDQPWVAEYSDPYLKTA